MTIPRWSIDLVLRGLILLSLVLLLGEIPLWSLGLAFVLLLWSLYNLSLGRGALSRWITGLLALTALGAVFFEFGTILGRDASVTYLAILAGLKSLEQRHPRDRRVLALIGLFLVAGKTLFTYNLIPSMIGASLTLGYVFVLVSLSLRANLTFQRSDMGQTLRILAYSLPLAALLFMFFPRVSGGLWALPIDARKGWAGFSGELRPGWLSEVISDDGLVFRAQFSDGFVPVTEMLYWRGEVLSETDGFFWSRGESPGNRSLSGSEREDLYPTRMTLEPHGNHWIFALDRPVNYQSAGSTSLLARFRQDETLSSLGAIQSRVTYRVESLFREYSEEVEIDPEAYLQLPDIPEDILDQAIALSVTAGSELERVAAVFEFFADGGFRYSLRPGRMRNLSEFFERKVGYSEHFASAAAVMLRAMGQPARVVIGFHGGSHNRVGDFWTITNQDAHAWLETYFAGRWWRMDPTAVLAPTRLRLGGTRFMEYNFQNIDEDDLAIWLASREEQVGFVGLLSQLWQSIESANHQWNLFLLEFDLEQQRRFVSQLGLQRLWTPIGFLSLFLALFVLLWLFVRVNFRGRSRLRPSQKLYLRLLYKLKRKEVALNGTEGPITVLEKAARSLPEKSGEIQAVVDYYISDCYRESGDDERAKERARSALKEI